MVYPGRLVPNPFGPLAGNFLGAIWVTTILWEPGIGCEPGNFPGEFGTNSPFWVGQKLRIIYL